MVMHLFGDRLEITLTVLLLNNVVSYENAFSRETTLNLMDSTALIIYDVIISCNNCRICKDFTILKID